MLARAEGGDADGPTFEVGDAADPLVPEQFETPDMHTGERDDWRTCLDRDDVGPGIVQAEVYLPVSDRRRYRGARCGNDISDISEAFGLE
jgi:hypothetical protein